MSLVHGKDINILKIKYINKILNNLTFDKKGFDRLSIRYPKYGINVESYLIKEKDVKLKIDNVETGFSKVSDFVLF